MDIYISVCLCCWVFMVIIFFFFFYSFKILSTESKQRIKFKFFYLFISKKKPFSLCSLLLFCLWLGHCVSKTNSLLFVSPSNLIQSSLFYINPESKVTKKKFHKINKSLALTINIITVTEGMWVGKRCHSNWKLLIQVCPSAMSPALRTLGIIFNVATKQQTTPNKRNTICIQHHKVCEPRELLWNSILAVRGWKW